MAAVKRGTEAAAEQINMLSLEKCFMKRKIGTRYK